MFYQELHWRDTLSIVFFFLPSLPSLSTQKKCQNLTTRLKLLLLLLEEVKDLHEQVPKKFLTPFWKLKKKLVCAKKKKKPLSKTCSEGSKIFLIRDFFYLIYGCFVWFSTNFHKIKWSLLSIYMFFVWFIFQEKKFSNWLKNS